MNRTLIDAFKQRRSYYAIGNESPISDEEIQKLLGDVLMYVPSAFNSQTTRIVLLLGKNHKKLWEIVKHVLKVITSSETFAQSEQKINNSFASGHGTILFFEDEAVVENLQLSFPTYKDSFPGWSLQTSAMHQFATWVLLKDAGLGASLQHYNPLIDEKVAEEWSLPNHWKLIAQMPFGVAMSEPAEKSFQNLEERIKVFK